MAAFGVSGVLSDPILTLYRGDTVLSSNDNWGNNAAQISSACAAVGAFPLVNPDSLDSALYNIGMQPGAYTVQLIGAAGATGIGLAEIYDAMANPTAGAPRLMNVSARSHVDTGGGILIAGIVVTGNAPKKILIRGIGPTLILFGVADVLADPKLELHAAANGRDSVITDNDNWGGEPLLNAAIATVGAFPLNAASKDAALLVTLLPGNYTAHVSGIRNSTGVALIEIYELP